MFENSDVILIGSGMGSLAAATLLARDGLKVKVIEQNWIPGGCTSSYPRKHFIFESGATTIVGLDEGMPLHYLCSETGIRLDALRLDKPMLVHLPDGQTALRHPDLESWIIEAERIFGKAGQRAFWEYCFGNAQFVWQTSIRQRRFPPKTLGDVLFTLKNSRPSQFRFATLAYRSMADLLRKHNLQDHALFRAFVDEQLMITAQNTAEEVNLLFGCTALSYTLFGNYYVEGGMMNLIQPFIQYIEGKGGQFLYREGVKKVEGMPDGTYRVITTKGHHSAKWVISGIPLNDTLPLFEGKWKGRLVKKELASAQLRGAVTLGIAFKRHKAPEVLHQQIILPQAIAPIGANSIFVSLSHPEDHQRAPGHMTVANVSMHVQNPEKTYVDDATKQAIEQQVIAELARLDILKPENIEYIHTSTPGSWHKWTKRHKGFVGGYPQYMHIKPWQMVEARLDGKGAYLCGDSAYPGQGIPGAALSGIVAYEKWKGDWGKRKG